MGLYDRDYQRGGYYDYQPGVHLSGPRTMATTLVIISAAVYLAQLLLGQWFTEALLLPANWYEKPWQVYRLLTYGFLHSPNDLWHIVLNMFALWMFGREVEYRYGRREFLAFYLAAIVVAGVVWTLAEIPSQFASVMIGASGGVTAVLILFALNFPHQTVLFMFIIPMPMWVLALLIVGMDALGAMNRSGNIAFTAHLGGAAFGFVYYQWRWGLERWLPSTDWLKRLRHKPKLRVVDPEEVDEAEERLNEILKKIHEHGQDSLTRGERRFLEQASREYQRKRR